MYNGDARANAMNQHAKEFAYVMDQRLMPG
jgi:hypothetical protein